MWNRSIRLACALAALAGAVPAMAQSNYPIWWTERNVATNVTVTNDYAPLNLGQLKWFATNACDELEEYLPGGAGTNAWNLVAGFVRTNGFVPANLGQLKYVAQPFYDRLIAEGYTNSYPWTTNMTADDADFAPANVGQGKQVFGFDLRRDSDADGLLDWWEIRDFGDLSQTAVSDFDGDGTGNMDEYLQGRDPTRGWMADTNGVVSLRVYTPLE